MILRAEEGNFLSNAYLIADRGTGKGMLVDSNGVTDPLVEFAEREGIEITQILLTHHHYDHVIGVEQLAERYGVGVWAHELCAEQVDAVTETIGDGDVVETPGLRVEALHTPGHCADHLAFKVNEGDCLTADVLFKGTCGGTGAPGATGIDDLRNSVMEKLMKLDRATRIHPGHRQPSTIGEEWEGNPFVRLWRGLDEPSAEPCTVGPDESNRREATLLLWAPDYDGGNKAMVRFADDGSEMIIGGSQVRRGAAA
jgi:glyoxylase-like metal-dependent hydrolase (beta-lactamase superfamily II)